jgi:hypothetical protein
MVVAHVRTLLVRHRLLLLQERQNPQLLISSPSRRRRVAEGSGRSEQDVAELMGAFTQMKAQTSQMSKIMKLGQGEDAGAHCSLQFCSCTLACMAAYWHAVKLVIAEVVVTSDCQSPH